MVFDKNLLVFGCRKEGISLPLSIIEHCLAKTVLNNSAFCHKSIFVKNRWNTRYFLLLWKDFSADQYVLGLVDGSINFFDKRI